MNKLKVALGGYMLIESTIGMMQCLLTPDVVKTSIKALGVEDNVKNRLIYRTGNTIGAITGLVILTNELTKGK